MTEKQDEKRKTYPIYFKPSIIEKWREFCDKYGFVKNRRLEIIMLKDMQERKVENTEELLERIEKESKELDKEVENIFIKLDEDYKEYRKKLEEIREILKT